MVTIQSYKKEFIMKKSSSICLFLFVAVLICCIAYGGGYYLSSYNSKKRTEQNLAQNEQKQQEEYSDSVKSDAVVNPFEFVLGEENGYIIVYNADKKTVYSKTDIRLDNLSAQLQKEIIVGKLIYSESELYNFLESYSS